MISISLGAIAQLIDAKIECSGEAAKDITISGINSPKDASRSDITFVTSAKYLDQMKESRAAAVILAPTAKVDITIPILVHENPYLAYAMLSAQFAKTSSVAGIHPSAQVAPTATLGGSTTLGPNVVVGENVVIGDNVRIDANTTIGENVRIGHRTKIYPNVSIYHAVSIGNDCIIHSGTVVGSDGFGYAPSSDGWVKIHQLGGVNIGNAVEIGGNTVIDRGALQDTILDDGVKIDNLVQISHNVRVGKDTAIAAQVGIAGSSKIGERCLFGGQVGVAGHLEITDNVQVSGKSIISKSIAKSGSYSSGTPFSDTKTWRRNAARFRSLDSIYKRLAALEAARKEKKHK